MTQPDEQIERLISRSLDGDLTADEQLELDRALIRSPQTRRCFEECRRSDGLAADALRTLFPVDSATPLSAPATVPSGDASRYRRGWWLVPAAAAATLAAILMLYPDRQPAAAPDRFAAVPSPTDNAVSVLPAVDRRSQPPRQAWGTDGPRFADHRLDRDWIGVRGADGNIYWLEIDRTTTFERPGTRSAVRLANSDL